MSNRPKLRKAIVAAPGPSLQNVADLVNEADWPVIAVQDAYRLVDADILYGCDARWWKHHKGCPDFKGQKWASHNHRDHADDKREVAELYGLNLIKGTAGDGYSTDPDVIHYGDNSGFQAINLAIAFGATYIVLVGYDMRFVEGKSHFFGDHPKGLYQRKEYAAFIKKFTEPPEGVTIINATPGSALEIYPIMEFRDATGIASSANRGREDSCLHWNGTELNAGAG